MKTQKINFSYNGKMTVAFYKLKASLDDGGTIPNFAFRDYKVLQNLLSAGLVEMRNSGVRNGKRYHATQKGIDSLAEIGVTP